MKKLIAILFSICVMPLYAATVVATVNGTPVTDTDITARTTLMARQGNTATDNRRRALQNIIDDSVKLNYAANFNAVPSDTDVDAEIKRMNLTGLSASEMAMARNAVKANMAWQVIVARTVLPTIEVTDADVAKEKAALARETGLPIEMTLVRLVDIPESVAKMLTRPKSCDDAVAMAEKLGGAPQKFSAVQYELASDIRERVVNLPKLTWSSLKDNSVLLVCDTKKTKEYGKLDEMIKQNAEYKLAMTTAEQQLKQLRRRAVVVINDARYK